MPLHKITVSMIVATSLIGGCSDSTTTGVDNSMLFEPCDDLPSLDCGVFEVPLVHGTTDSRRIRIDVARLSGTGEGPHEPLLLNLGGPGSGTETLRDVMNNGLLDQVRESYDIIGFDQRGVGNPLRVDCDQLGDAESFPYPRDQNDVQTLVDKTTLLADACLTEYSDQLQWVGSNSVVQDMEVMRTMLNAPKLNIIGLSFGSRITALYLQRYPETSGRIIMDAPIRPDASIESLQMGTAVAQQGSFEQMVDACGTTLPDCDRAMVEGAFVARANSLLDDEDHDTFGAFFDLLEIAVQDTRSGEVLAPFLIDYAFSGDPTEMFLLIQELGLGEEDDVGEGDSAGDSITLERAVMCADDNARPTVESLISSLNALNEGSDLFAEALLPDAASCVGWPEALDPIADIQTTDAPASLTIGGSDDVLTPLSWAVEMAEAVGGVFVSSAHPGHGTLFVHENECVDSITVEFLLEGTLPPDGTICQ